MNGSNDKRLFVACFTALIATAFGFIVRAMIMDDWAKQFGLSETQMSLFRSGKVKGIRFRTLARLCAALGCTPGELLGYDFDAADLQGEDDGAI